MFKHFFLVTIRRFVRDKTLSFINIFGLVVGLASIFLLSKYIGFYLTRDDFQENKENLFAVHQTLNSNTVSNKYSKSTFNGVGPILKERFGEVKGMSRYITTAEMLFISKMGDGSIQKNNENNIVEVDPDFLKMVTLDFISGNPETALIEPNTMVISVSLARKYFGDKNPLGLTITSTKRWGGKNEWLITGVFEDYPKRSIFRFDALQSLTNKKFEVSSQDWNYPYFKSYLLLDENINSQDLEIKMSAALNNFEGLKNNNKSLQLHLKPFEELIALTDWQKGLIIIGVVLMLMTWMNYTNLSMSQSIKRNLEYGVRKVMGSNRLIFVKQFLYEALVVYVLAIFGSALLVALIYPVIFQLTDGTILPILDFQNPINMLPLIFLIVGSIISSIVPPFALSGLSISGLMKGKVHNSLSLGGFKNILVSLQLIISVIMLTGIVTISNQMQYIQNKDLGINTNQILILKSPKDGWDGKHQRLSSLKQELRNMAKVQSVTSSTTVPLWWSGAPTDYKLNENSNDVRVKRIGVDEYYFDCFGVDLIAGKNFYKDDSGRAQKSAIVNETAAKLFGFQDPSKALNQKVTDQKTDETFTIIGVSRDYHHESLRNAITPQLFLHNPYVGFISIRFDSPKAESMAGLSNYISDTEILWNKIYPSQAFDFYFMDDRLQQMYSDEKLFKSIFYAVAIICVIVNFLGIFGLSIFISLSKRKEIGVRKTLGANQKQIVFLFTSEFKKKLTGAILVGCPIAYYLTTLWLQNFTYQMSIQIWHFILPSLVLIVLVQLSLAFESMKMAKTNPIEILHEE